MKKKAKLDLSRSWVAVTTVGFGIRIYALFVTDCVAPLGLVWGAAWGGKKEMFQVFGSFVVVSARRLGVRTKINTEIFKQGTDVITSGATSKAGAAFMRATGYRYDQGSDTYILEKPKRTASDRTHKTKRK